MRTLRDWLIQFGKRFDEEELNTGVYKAIIKISAVNTATGNIEVHRFDYNSKEALKEDEVNIRR